MFYSAQKHLSHGNNWNIFTKLTSSDSVLENFNYDPAIPLDLIITLAFKITGIISNFKEKDLGQHTLLFKQVYMGPDELF